MFINKILQLIDKDINCLEQLWKYENSIRWLDLYAISYIHNHTLIQVCILNIYEYNRNIENNFRY